MKNKLFCSREPRQPAIKLQTLALAVCTAMGALLCSIQAGASSNQAPQWMHSVVGASLPTYDEKTNAVLIYSETNVTVVSSDKTRTQVRKIYKILRPSGRDYGTVYVPYTSPAQKVISLHGWCIPASGKDYEVNDKSVIDISAPKVDGGELISDFRMKVLAIPAPDPGNIIGYEYEVEEHPLVLQDNWEFQEETPVRESRYSLQLPAGWEFKASWINAAEIKPTSDSSNTWHWVVNNIKEVRKEEQMPPFAGVVGQMVVSFLPPGGISVASGFSNWHEMGNWYWNLEKDRFDASPEIKQEVTTLTSSSPTPVAKMKAIGGFVQHDIRYVAIELGIGGWQPHPAASIFTNKYGDCKDKATLTRSMLKEVGIESYQVAINTERGSITPATPAHQGFNHQITAIKIPDGVTDPSLIAILQHPKLGKLLFFDPTDEVTPFGQINGELQANWGLIISPEGGELVELPKQPASMNSIQRTAKLTLDPNGTLKGDVTEIRLGDKAWTQRWRLRTTTHDADRIKPIENLLGSSLADFHVTKATVLNLNATDKPFGFEYSFVSQNYAKSAGNLLLVRPRVIGSKSSGLLETKEPRQFPIEFDGPSWDTDTFEIALPPGYVVDDLPPPVDADFSFASYHSKSEISGNVIRYTRALEVKELSVPVEKSSELKQFYRIIAGDERNTAVLKPVSP